MPIIATASHLFLVVVLALGACPAADVPVQVFADAQVGEFVSGIMGMGHGYEVQQSMDFGHPNDAYTIRCCRIRHLTEDEGLRETVLITNRNWPRRYSVADYLLDTRRAGLTTNGMILSLSTSAVSFFADHVIERSCADRELRAFIARCEGHQIADRLTGRSMSFSSAEITCAEHLANGRWRLHWGPIFRDFLATDQEVTLVGIGVERA